MGATYMHLSLSDLMKRLAAIGRSREVIELAGEPEFISATFVSGLKRLPIRYELS
jgi:hypothetical protein